MKSGGMYRIRGKHFTYSLIALVIATVFLWYLEKKPLVTVLSTLDQLYLPNSDVQLVARDSKDFVIPNYSSPEHGHSRKEPQNEPITDGSVASDVDSTSRINSIMESNGPELTPSLDNYAKKDADQRSNMQDSPHSLDNNDSATHQRSDEPELTSFLDKNDEKDAHKNSDGQELPHSIDSNDRDPHQILDESELTPSLVSNGGKGAHQRSDDLELTPTLDRNGKNDSHQRSHELELTPTLDSNDGEAAHQRSHDQEVTASLDSNDDKDGHHRSNEQELIRPLHSNDEKISLQRSNEQDFTPSLDSNGGKDPHQRSNKQDLTPSLDSNGGKDAHQIPNKQDLALKLASNGGKDAEQRDDGNSEFSSGNKECNYVKGRWVVDNKRHPLYSGFKCKQWLSDMWACRLTWRPDFSYEAYRWQPEGCKMPRFDGPTFLKKMQNKTIAFVGDSLGRQQFQSLMCMVTGGNHHPEVQDVGKKYGFFLSRGAARPNGWAFRFPATNTTILYHWTACLCELEPLNSTDPHSTVAMHLDRAATFLQQFLPALNVVILNTGHHWNRGKLNANRWVMYVGGKPNTDKIRARMGNAKDFTIHSVARWLDEQIGTHHPHVKAFFRTISPRHFAHGDWNTGGSCDNTIPLANGNAVMEEQSRDHAVAGAVRGTRVRLLDVTALSQLRDEGHISRYRSKGSTGFQDCLHWCLPGIPDTWNEILAAQI